MVLNVRRDGPVQLPTNSEDREYGTGNDMRMMHENNRHDDSLVAITMLCQIFLINKRQSNRDML